MDLHRVKTSECLTIAAPIVEPRPSFYGSNEAGRKLKHTKMLTMKRMAGTRKTAPTSWAEVSIPSSESEFAKMSALRCLRSKLAS